MRGYRVTRLASGQTALEYAMVILMIIIPLAVTVRKILADSSSTKHDNAVRLVVTDSYGDEKHLGAIGRPWP